MLSNLWSGHLAYIFRDALIGCCMVVSSGLIDKWRSVPAAPWCLAYGFDHRVQLADHSVQIKSTRERISLLDAAPCVD